MTGSSGVPRANKAPCWTVRLAPGAKRNVVPAGTVRMALFTTVMLWRMFATVWPEPPIVVLTPMFPA